MTLSDKVKRAIGSRKSASSAGQLARLAALAPPVLCTFRMDPSGRLSMPYASPRLERIYGLSPEDVIEDASPLFARMHPEDLERVRRSVLASAKSMREWSCEFRVMHPTAGQIWVEGHSTPEAEPDGSILWHGYINDITERRRTQSAARIQAQLLEDAFDAIIVREPNGSIHYWNRGAIALFGYQKEQVLAKACDELLETFHPQGLAAIERQLRDTGVWVGELQHRRADGRTVYVEARKRVVVTADGEILVYETHRDVTARHQAEIVAREDLRQRELAERALRESEERFRQLAENIRDVFWLADAERTRFLYVSPAYEGIWGRSPATLFAGADAWLTAVHAEDRERVVAAVAESLRTGVYEERYRIVRSDGSVRWIREQAFPVRDEHGRVVRLAGIAEDITEQLRLEAQLLQRQKMESIGQLAGGLAHDLNNVLTVILGCNDFLKRSVEYSSGRSAELLSESQDAALRAASLTRQLLAFSRQEVVAPRIVNINAIVSETEKMLRRLLGEDIALNTELEPELHAVKADPSQLVQVLVNLAVNARDAMPHGGVLSIETSNAELADGHPALASGALRGRCVRLTVSDTGVGMTPEVRARAFEPFFTTKGIGQGTGLGLAVTHGIVQQSSGHIELRSEPGRGTIFEIFLPAVAEPARSTSVVPSTSIRGSERVLLVEDEPTVRRAAARTLRASGYEVLEAGSGEEALRIVMQRGVEVAILITDVVMPGIDGRELAALTLEHVPQIRVLYTSGYTDDAVVRHGVLRAEVEFLQKPYTPGLLLRKVRQVLDAGEARQRRSHAPPSERDRQRVLDRMSD